MSSQIGVVVTLDIVTSVFLLKWDDVSKFVLRKTRLKGYFNLEQNTRMTFHEVCLSKTINNQVEISQTRNASTLQKSNRNG